jgi:hypothetical protein
MSEQPSNIRILRPRDGTEPAPFDLWRYNCALTRNGLAKTLGSALSTLLTIAGYADTTGCCWRSAQTIAQGTGGSVQDVLRDITRLEACRALRVVRCTDGATPCYILLPVEGIRPAPQAVERAQEPLFPPEPPCSRPPRRTRATLAQREPQLAADRDAAIRYWRDLTGQVPHAGTRREVERLLREHSLQDITGTIDAMWWEVNQWGRPTGFWQRGGMSWAAIGNRIAAFKAGRLRYRAPADKEG